MFSFHMGYNNGMKLVIMQELGNATLLGGGAVNHTILSQCLTIAPNLVAADGAADTALALGHTPLAVIGDLDSVSDSARKTLGQDRIIETPDQMRTDFDKALDVISAPLVLGVGFMGGRLDHELACYNALVRMPNRTCILVGEEDLCFHVPSGFEISLPKGTRFSLFPMAKVVANCRGVLWPVEDLEMAPWAQIGTSNEATGGRIELVCDRPGMLVILPRVHLAAVVAALTV